MNFQISNEQHKEAIIQGSADGFMSVIADSALIAAQQMREAYPSIKRYINISTDTIGAIDAAYKTGSGLYSEKHQIISRSIYDMSKVEVALTIVEHDSSDAAFDRAAFEIARDAFVSGQVEERAELLSAAAGESVEACIKLINSKLRRMENNLKTRSGKTATQGEAAPSAEEIKEIIMAAPGRYLVQLPTGEGKTSRIAEPVIDAYLKEGKKVVVISHRRSINAGLCDGIEGIISYDKVTRPTDLIENSGLKVVVNSLSKATFKSFLSGVDLVVIDEASQVISHILGGEVKEREAVWEALNKVVTTAKSVIFTDADMSQACVEMIGEARFFKKEQKHHDITVSTGSTDTVRALIMKDAQDGKNVLVACDVAKEARALGKMIEKQTGRSALVITADNALWADQAAFIADPNSSRNDIVIYSPVITSALSITSDHFQAHYGLFQGQVIPSDAVQMLRRSRTATSFTIGLKNPEYRKTEQVEMTFNESNFRMLELLNTIDIKEKDRIKIMHEIDSSARIDAFNKIRYAHCADEAWLKDNIQNTLPATLKSQGFKIEVLEQDNDTKIEGFKIRSQGFKVLKKDIAEKLLASKNAGSEVVKRVKDNGSRSEEEHIAVIRSRATQVLNKRNLDEKDAKFWGEGEGEGKLNRFKKLYNEVNLTSDEEKVINALKPVLTAMMLTKEWKPSDSAQIIDQMQHMKSALISMGINLGKASTERAKQAALTRILGSFGIKTKKVNGGDVRGYYYVVDMKSVEYMVSIV